MVAREAAGGVGACRQISSQGQREFTSSDYGNIKRVYSIWICMNQPENGITRYRLERSDLFGAIHWKGDPALLNIVMVGITEPPHEREAGGYELNRLLSTLLSMEMPPEEKLGILRDEYDIAGDEIRDICNLSDGIMEKGMNLGREEGRREGLERGVKRGRKEGRQEERVKIILTMHDNDFTPEQIALATEKSEEEIRAIIRERRVGRARHIWRGQVAKMSLAVWQVIARGCGGTRDVPNFEGQ